MANVQISDLALATLPIDTVNTFFELQTIEGGIQVSRKLSAQDLGIGGGVTSVNSGQNIVVDNTDPMNPIVNFDPAPTGAFNMLVANAGGTDWEETDNLQVLATQVAVQNGFNFRLRSGGVLAINTDDDIATALSITGPATTGGETVFAFTGNATFQTGGQARYQISDINSRHVFLDFPLFLEERAAAGASVGGFGQLWVRDDSPNVLVFTDDTGVDTVLGSGGGGTPGGANTNVQYNNAGAFGGDSGFTYDGAGNVDQAGSQARLTIDETDGGGDGRVQLTSTTTADGGAAVLFDSGTGRLALQQTDDSGNLEDLWINMQRNGAVQFYHNGNQQFVTTANGIELGGALFDFVPTALLTDARMLLRNAAGGVSLNQDANTGVFLISQTNPAGTDQDSWIECTRDGDVALFHNNVEMARTAVAASGGMEVNNTVTGAGFERVLTTSDIGGGGVNSVTAGNQLTNSGTAADPILDVDDPLILDSIHLQSALLPATGSPYNNVPINIGANLTGTTGMLQLARQRIQSRPSSFSFNSTLFIHSQGGDVSIGDLNGANLTVNNGVAVELQHDGSSNIICQTVANGLQLPIDGTLFIDERASAAADITNHGQLWVQSQAFAQWLMYTPENGADIIVAGLPDSDVSAGSVVIAGTSFVAVANIGNVQSTTWMILANVEVTAPAADDINIQFTVNTGSVFKGVLTASDGTISQIESTTGEVVTNSVLVTTDGSASPDGTYVSIQGILIADSVAQTVSLRVAKNADTGADGAAIRATIKALPCSNP